MADESAVIGDRTAAPRGRDRFRQFRFAIDTITAALSVLPLSLRRWLWRAVAGWQGLGGIGLRYCLLRTLAAKCGDNVLVGPNVDIRGWAGLFIGENVSIHRDCYIDATGGIEIGNDVSVAHATSMLSFEHTWEDKSRPIRDNPLKYARVVVHDDVWIGCGVRILAGAEIGTRSVVAAGAVVTRAVPAWSIAGGVPARVIGSTTPDLAAGKVG